MKKLLFVLLAVVLVSALTIFSCVSEPSANSNSHDTLPQVPYFTGSGGKGTSLAILKTKTETLPADEQWLSSFVQGILTSNFSRYTAMTVVDRQYMDDIIQNQIDSSSGYFSDNDFISIGSLTNAEYILVGSLQKIQQVSSYLFDLSLVNAKTGEQRASFPPTTCSFADIQNTAVIQTAFENIISQLEIALTESGKSAIRNINQSSIAAESSLSKGIVAQENGRIGEALSYYYNAASFIPNIKEVNSRISILSSNVNSGNIGQNARNLIALRNSWANILSECDDFLEKHIPFEIIYDPRIKQEGKINYSSGTVDLALSIITKPTEGFKIIDDVLKGLKSTGRQEEWGFQLWPFDNLVTRYRTSQPLPSGYTPMWDSSNRHVSYVDKEVRIVIALLDINGQIISRYNGVLPCRWGTREFKLEWWDGGRGFYSGNYWFQKNSTVKPESIKNTHILRNVDANKITDTITIKILTVDGIDAETATMDGYIKISTGRL